MKEMNNICLISGWPKYLKERSMGSYYTKAYIKLGIQFEMEKVKGVLLCTASYMNYLPSSSFSIASYQGACL